MTRPKSILMVGNFLPDTVHYGTVGSDLSARLRTEGWRVMIASKKQNRLIKLFDMVFTAWRFRHQFDVAQVDVFSGPAFAWAEAVAWTLRRTGRPYILTLHGGGLPEFAERWPARVSRLLTKATLVTSPSEYLAAKLQHCRSDIRVIPNGIELTRYPFHERSHPRPYLVWLRAFHETYNPTMALRAIEALTKRYPGLVLRMIGADKRDGSLQSCERMRSELKLNGRVEFAAAVPREAVARELNAADLFLNTSSFDNTPVSVIEAMACGLGIVSTRVGGIPWLLKDGVNALLVDAGNAPAMAASIARLLEEHELTSHLSKQARRWAEQFDWTKVMSRWKEILSEVSPACGSAKPPVAV